MSSDQSVNSEDDHDNVTELSVSNNNDSEWTLNVKNEDIQVNFLK